MDDLFSFIEILFSGSWDLLTTVDYPMLGVSVGAVLVGSVLAVFGIKFIKLMVDLPVGYSSSLKFDKTKISPARRYDTR